ncbi:MFS transporter, partial [Galactobacter sp.]|uniref:MFS transporter n=1 Tax=Galactobacter sp. TaxID=2676125 RepID=UPI0025B8BF52
RVGNLVGPLLGAAIMLVAPIWSVFVLAAAMAAAATVVVCLPAGRALDAPRPSRRRVRAPMPDERGSAPATPEDEGATDGRATPVGTASRPSLRQLQVRWNAVVLVGVSITALTVARAGQPIIVQLWGVHLGLHESAISSLIAIGAAVELLFMFLGGYLKERWGRAAILVTCLGVFGIGFLVMVWWQHLTGLIVAVLIMALGNGLGAGVNMTIGADLSPAVGRARFLGVWAMFNNIGRLGGPALTSFLIAAASLSTGIAVTGGIALAGAAWMCVVARRVGLPGPTRSGRQ